MHPQTEPKKLTPDVDIPVRPPRTGVNKFIVLFFYCAKKKHPLLTPLLASLSQHSTRSLTSPVLPLLVVGAAEDDRPKIKGLFWVVLVFGRA